MLRAVFLVVLAVSCTVAQECDYKPVCPPIKPMEKVDWQKYSGKWIKFFEGDAMNFKCAIYDYVYLDGPQYNLITNAKKNDGTPFNSTSKVNMGNPCSNPKADYMYFPESSDSAEGHTFLPPMDLFVLETDYNSYTVEYACVVDADGNKKDIVAVEGREETLPYPKEKWEKIMEDNGIDKNILKPSRTIC